MVVLPMVKLVKTELVYRFTDGKLVKTELVPGGSL